MSQKRCCLINLVQRKAESPASQISRLKQSLTLKKKWPRMDIARQLWQSSNLAGRHEGRRWRSVKDFFSLSDVRTKLSYRMYKANGLYKPVG